MQHFQFYSAASLGDALGFLAEKGDRTRVLAGGTDLIPALREETSRPGFVLNILEVAELNGVRDTDQGLRIGSATSHAQLTESDLVKRYCPSLAQAAGSIGGPLVRNRGTIGGNLVNASPAADLASTLLSLDAEAVIRSRKGTRVVALSEFFLGPGKTVLNPEELLTEIAIPRPRGLGVFLKLGRRQAMTLSVVNVAVCLAMEDGRCREARIALGSVAPTPIRCPGAERMLLNQQMNEELAAQCAQAAMAASSPIDDQRAKAWYRVQAGTVLVRRALARAAGLGRT